MSELDKLSQLLYAPGEVMPGVGITAEQARERMEIICHKSWTPYCVVSDWIWIDLVMTEREKKFSQVLGQQPVMLYAYYVIFDSELRLQVGDWVRTSLLVSFSEDCFFQTLNTLYVLVGEGVRKQAELSTVMSLR
nr:hypothetical protein [Pseudomonas oleovorans]